MKKGLLIFIISFIFFLSYLSANDIQENKSSDSHIIILKNGKEYKGKLIEINDENVIFFINGKKEVFNKKDVTRIQFHKKRLYEDVKIIKKINDIEIKKAWEESKKWKESKDLEVVFLLDKVNIEFIQDGLVKLNFKKAIKILNEEGKNYSTQYFYYLNNYRKPEILYGITVSPEGKVTCLEESAINDEPVNNEYPQYDLLNRVKFGLKDVDVGSVIIWEAEIIEKWDLLKNPFLFEKYLVNSNYNVKKELIIKAPEDLNINLALHNGLIPFKTGKSDKKTEKKNIIYSYVQENIKLFINDEDNTPHDSIIYPWFIIACNAKSWDELSGLYYDKYFNKPINIDIKNLALSIVKNEKDSSVILSKLYEWVNRSINLVDVDMEEYSYCPNDEDKIISSSSLNVLDKSYLFTRMANALNIPVKMYFYKKSYKDKLIDNCFNLKQFDSVICESNIKNNKTIYSFENENFRLGQVYYSASEAQALDVTAPAGKIIMLPKLESDYNKYNYEYQCILSEDDTLNIKKITTIYGNEEIEWREKRFLSKDEFDIYMESRISNLGNNVKIVDYKFINKLDDFNNPVKFEENIIVYNYSYSSGKNLKLFKIPDLKYSAGSVSKSQRSLPYDIGITSTSNYDFEIIFPKKYKLQYMPQPLDISNDLFCFKSNYENKGNKLITGFKSVYYSKIIPISSYGIFKEYIENRSKLLAEWIILEDM